MKQGHGLLVAVGVLCLATAVQAQYVEDSIDVGHAWVGSLAYNSCEDVIYGASESGVFFAISCDSNKLIKSLPLGGAFAVAYDSVDNKAYCTFGDSLLVVDGATHSRIKSLPMEVATNPVWDPVSDRVYVSCQTTNKVAVVDCSTDSVLKYINVGACPLKLYLNTPGRKLYVQNYDAGSVSIIALTDDHVIKTLNVGGYPNAGYYCDGADKFYSAGLCECVVIGGQSDTIVARVQLPGNVEVTGATGSKNGELVYVGTYDGGLDDYVATISTANDSLQGSVTVDGDPVALACFWSSGLVYCATLGARLFVLSSDGSQVLDSLQVGWYPFVFAQVPRHNRLYLGHLGSRYVYVLRDTSLGVSEQEPRPKFSGVLRASPNPFTMSVNLTWESQSEAGGTVRVYAQDGRLVRQAEIQSGQSRWVWDGRDDSGAPLPPGVYVLESGPGVRAKVIKLK